MSDSLLKIVDELTRIKDIDKDEMMEIIRDSIKEAYLRKYKLKKREEDEEPYDLPLDVEVQAGVLRIFISKWVVKEVEDPHIEISMEDAEALTGIKDLQEDDVVDVFIDAKDLGRNGAQVVKENILNRIKGFEQRRIYEEYIDKVGEVYTGIVTRKQRLRGKERDNYLREHSDHLGEGGYELANIIVDLGKGEGIIPPRHQTPKDSYYRGTRLKVYIYAVKEEGLDTKILVSRTHENLLRGLFELEIPEVAGKQVEIMAIAREPGARAKVAVWARNSDLDPVGTCVGVRGIRIQNIVRELNGERIDVVEWSDEPKQMIRNALKTVDISKVIIEERADERRNVKVVVPDEQYTMAIGRNGQNVRLAAKLTGWKIYIYSETEYHKELEEKREQYTNILKNFDGMNEEILGAMYDAGIFDLEEIAELTAEGFAEEVEGVDIDMAASFINAARTALEELKQEAQAGPETAASESEALEEETDSPEKELQESEDADNPEEGTEEPEDEAEQEEEDPSEKPEA